MANPVNYLYTDRSLSGGSGAFSYITLSGLMYNSFTNGITAFSGGGQTSAVLLTTQKNRVTTTAVNGDSVLLPPAVVGLTINVANAGVATLAVFPSTGDAINALSANSSFSVAAAKSCSFACAVAGIWNSLLSA